MSQATSYKEGDFLTPSAVAKLVHKSEKSLANERSQKRGIPYVKIGGRILYLQSDIDRLVEFGRVRTF